MKAKILIIPGYKIFPIEMGSAIAQAGFIDKQQYLYELYVIVNPENVFLEDLPNLKKRWPKVTFFLVGYNNSCTKTAVLVPFKENILLKFLNKITNISYRFFGYKVKEKETIVSPEPDVYINDCRQLLKNFIFSGNQYLDEIQEILANNTFDIIQVELSNNLKLINILPHNSKKIFIQHESVSKRLMTLEYSAKIKNPEYQIIYAQARSLEFSFLNRFDAVIVFSEEDKSYLHYELKVPIYISPFPILDSMFSFNTQFSEAKVNRLSTIGSEGHLPNKHGILWFIDNVMSLPEIHSNFKLYVIGKWSIYGVSKYQNNPSISFLGFVEDIKGYINNTLFIVPVFIGGGLRSKILTAMAMGLPVISTKFAAEGIPYINGETILIADTPSAFSEKIKLLSDDFALRKKIVINAYELVKRAFSQEIVTSIRDKVYKDIMANNKTTSNL